MTRRPPAPPTPSAQPNDFTWLPFAALQRWDKNPRRNERAIDPVARSIARWGFVRPITVWTSKKRMVAGHTALSAFERIIQHGYAGPDGRAIPAQPSFCAKGAPGPGLVPVRFHEFESEAEANAYAIADNKLAEIAAWDEEGLAQLLREQQEVDALLPKLAGFSEHELAALLRTDDGDGEDKKKKKGGEDDGDGEGDEEEESQAHEYAQRMLEKWQVERGQLWVAQSITAPGGEHRILCGDSTNPDSFKLLLPQGEAARLVLTDPPYCSGGFQEAQRARGSGSGRMQIANDNLSAEGFLALIQSVFEAVSPEAAYVFTDWRMWAHLGRALETKGLPARSMIVWDKETHGTGHLWRTQHELIAFTTRTSTKRIKGAPAFGNVLKARRSGNRRHVTEKPISLLQLLLQGDSACDRTKCPVIDPFAGSGTTLAACEIEGRLGRGVELSPGWMSVALERLSEMGCTPRRMS